MNLELRQKRVLVTGSSRGIGRAIAKTFIQEGGAVFLNARQEAPLAQASEQMGAAGYCAADVTQPEEARRLVAMATKQMGGLDILVCNVGDGQFRGTSPNDPAESERMLKVNFLSATQVIEAANTSLIENRGVVICVSSICGCESIAGAPVAYSAAKKALNEYVKELGRAFGPEGVRVLAVAPGNIFFEGSSWEKKVRENPAQVQAMLKKEVPMGRFGTPQEIADFCVFLASPRASFATAQVYIVDGGQTRK